MMPRKPDDHVANEGASQSEPSMQMLFDMMAQERERNEAHKVSQHVHAVACRIRQQKGLPAANANAGQQRFEACAHHCSADTCRPQGLMSHAATPIPPHHRRAGRPHNKVAESDVFVCRFGAVHVCRGDTRLEDCVPGTVPCRFESVGLGRHVCMLTGRDHGSVINNTIVGTPRGHIVGKRRSNFKERMRDNEYTIADQAATEQVALSGAASLASPLRTAASPRRAAASPRHAAATAEAAAAPRLVPVPQEPQTIERVPGRGGSPRGAKRAREENDGSGGQNGPPDKQTRFLVPRQQQRRRRGKPLSRQARQRLRQKSRGHRRRHAGRPWEEGEARWQCSEARHTTAKRREAEHILRTLLKPSLNGRLLLKTQAHLKVLKQAAKAMLHYRQQCVEMRQPVSCYEQFVLFLTHAGTALLAPEEPLSGLPPGGDAARGAQEVGAAEEAEATAAAPPPPRRLTTTTAAAAAAPRPSPPLSDTPRSQHERDVAQHYVEKERRAKRDEDSYVVIQWATNVIMAHWRMVVMTFENSAAQVTICKFRQLVLAVLYQMRQPDGLVWYQRCIIPHSAYLKRHLPDETQLEHYANDSLPYLNLREIGKGKHMLLEALKAWEDRVPYDELAAAFTDQTQDVHLV